MRYRTINVLIGVSLLAGACAPADRADITEEPPASMTAAPDTTAGSLWSHVTAANYQAWSHWPGTNPLYRGQEPHGMLLTTYVNGLALDAIRNGAGRMPAGAIVVKENYMPDSTLAAVTVMFKVPGYDAQHNDWFWLKRNVDGTVDGEGRVPMCASCHLGQRDNDYLFTGTLTGAR